MVRPERLRVVVIMSFPPVQQITIPLKRTVAGEENRVPGPCAMKRALKPKADEAGTTGPRGRAIPEPTPPGHTGWTGARSPVTRASFKGRPTVQEYGTRWSVFSPNGPMPHHQYGTQTHEHLQSDWSQPWARA